MGKMKELYMKQNFPNGDYDLEREYLINDLLAQEQDYLGYQKLKQEEEMNVLNTKIQVIHGTKIEVDTENIKTNREFALQ
jgi:hypothetical protein